MGRAHPRRRRTEEQRKGRCCFGGYFSPSSELLTTELQPPATALRLSAFYPENPAINPSAAAPLRSDSLSTLRSTAYGAGGDAAAARGRSTAAACSSSPLYPSYSMVSIALPVTVVGLAAVIALLFVGMGVLIYCYLRILSGASGAAAFHSESHGGEGRPAMPQYSGNTNLNVPKPDDIGGVGNGGDDGPAKVVVIMAGNDIPSFIAFSTPLQHSHQQQTPGLEIMV